MSSIRSRVLAPVVALLLVPAAVEAEPYLAVRYGYKCSQCHLNPTGGGKRNKFGNIFSQTELPSTVLSASDFGRFLSLDEDEEESSDEMDAEEDGFSLPDLAPGSTFYSGYVTRFLSIGGDFRVTNTTIFRNADDSTSNSFDLSEGNLYASFEFFDGALALYLDETVAPGGAAAREAYGLFRGPWGSYVKAGRMMLPFGIRLQDDTAFIREISGFNYGVQDLGVEVGLEPGPFSMSLAVSNGSQGSSDDNKDKQVTGMVSYIQRYWRAGAHATWNNTPVAKSIAFGGFAGLNFGRFTLLGEIDHIIDELEILPGEPFQRQLLVYGAANYYLTKGVNLKFTYDFADPDTTESDDSFIRVSAGVEYFVTQFLQLRAFFRFRDETEDSLRDDESSLLFELHAFF